MTESRPPDNPLNPSNPSTVGPVEGAEASDAPEAPINGRTARSRSDFHEVQDPVESRAVAYSDPTRIEVARQRAVRCAQIVEDGRARDICLLDVRTATPLVDFMVLATADSRRQTQAIAEEIRVTMKQAGEPPLGIEGLEEGRWVLLDFSDYVVHLFSPDARDYYALDDLYGDADPIAFSQHEGSSRPQAPDNAPAVIEQMPTEIEQPEPNSADSDETD